MLETIYQEIVLPIWQMPLFGKHPPQKFHFRSECPTLEQKFLLSLVYGLLNPLSERTTQTLSLYLIHEWIARFFLY